MSLNNISYCRYLAKRDGSWTQEQWQARDIVRSIKGEAFGGHVDLVIGGKNRTLDQAHSELAFYWFAETVEKQTKFEGTAGYALCPIPDRLCTATCGRSSKTMKIAEALASRLPKLKVWDGLRFTREMASTRSTNMRDPEKIFQALTLISRIPDKYIILLDDVCTTGAHARAAARIIRKNGNQHVCAMSVARTMLDSDEKVFGFRSDPLGD